MYETEKSRADMLEQSLKESEVLQRASELEETVIKLRSENEKLKSAAETDASNSDPENLKEEISRLTVEKKTLEERIDEMRTLAIAAIGEKDTVIKDQEEKLHEMQTVYDRHVESSCTEIKALEQKVYNLSRSNTSTGSEHSANEDVNELRVISS